MLLDDRHDRQRPVNAVPHLAGKAPVISQPDGDSYREEK